MSLLVVAVILFEMRSATQLQAAEELQLQARQPMQQIQEMEPAARVLVQKIAVASTQDTALRDLLARHGFKVTPLPAPTGATANYNP